MKIILNLVNFSFAYLKLHSEDRGTFFIYVWTCSPGPARDEQFSWSWSGPYSFVPGYTQAILHGPYEMYCKNVKEYIYVGKNLNWVEAVSECRSMNAELALIDSEEQNKKGPGDKVYGLDRKYTLSHFTIRPVTIRIHNP